MHHVQAVKQWVFQGTDVESMRNTDWDRGTSASESADLPVIKAPWCLKDGDIVLCKVLLGDSETRLGKNKCAVAGSTRGRVAQREIEEEAVASRDRRRERKAPTCGSGSENCQVLLEDDCFFDFTNRPEDVARRKQEEEAKRAKQQQEQEQTQKEKEQSAVNGTEGN